MRPSCPPENPQWAAEFPSQFTYRIGGAYWTGSYRDARYLHPHLVLPIQRHDRIPFNTTCLPCAFCKAQTLHLIQPILTSTISKEAYPPPIPSRESLAKLIHPPRISTSAARCAAPTLLRRWIGGSNYNLPLPIAKCCVLNHHAACRSQFAISKT